LLNLICWLEENKIARIEGREVIIVDLIEGWGSGQPQVFLFTSNLLSIQQLIDS